MKPRRRTTGVAALALAATLLGACGSSVSQVVPKRPLPKTLVTACTQLERQPKERVADASQSGSGYYVYEIPPSLVIALQKSGNAALRRLGRQLVVPGTDSKVTTSDPKAFDQGQLLCRSLMR
jgi:hypothetical protein